MAPRMCWLGAGNMGRAMARALVDRGNLEQPLIVWSRTFEHALELHRTTEKTVVADSLETAVARADIVWSCLSDDEAVTSLFERIARGCDVRGKVFVECTTVRPATADAVAAAVLARGGEYVAMPPLLGDVGAARSGTLVVAPAGARHSVDKVAPYLAGVLAHTVVDYGGENPGKAPLIKMVGGMGVVSVIESIAEAHVLADKTGLGAERIEQFLDSVMPDPNMLYSKRFTPGAYCKPMACAGRPLSSSSSSAPSAPAVVGGAFGRVPSRARIQRRSCNKQQQQQQRRRRYVNKKRCNALTALHSQPVISVEMALKVARLVKEAATATGTAVPSYEIAAKLMGEVAREDGVSEDVSSMYGVLRKASGLPYVNQ